MSSNVGLSTPRGSGTSGYVQRNLSVLKPRSTGTGAPYTTTAHTAPRPRQPDQSILRHDRLRDIEISVLELRDRLEDEGVDDEDIDEQCEKLRGKLMLEMESGGAKKGGSGGAGRAIKGYQVHEAAEAKAVESERLRRALGLGAGKVRGEEDGDEHPMARQERRRREREEERVRVELEGVDGGREREGDEDEDAQWERRRG